MGTTWDKLIDQFLAQFLAEPEPVPPAPDVTTVRHPLPSEGLALAVLQAEHALIELPWLRGVLPTWQANLAFGMERSHYGYGSSIGWGGAGTSIDGSGYTTAEARCADKL